MSYLAVLLFHFSQTNTHFVYSLFNVEKKKVSRNLLEVVQASTYLLIFYFEDIRIKQLREELLGALLIFMPKAT